MQYNVADLNQIYMHAPVRFSILPTKTCIMRAEGFWINNLREQVLARFFNVNIQDGERAAGSEQIKLNFCQPIIERSF